MGVVDRFGTLKVTVGCQVSAESDCFSDSFEKAQRRRAQKMQRAVSSPTTTALSSHIRTVYFGSLYRAKTHEKRR